MSSYPSITTYSSLLAAGNLGSQNMQFYNAQGQLVQPTNALDTFKYEDENNFQLFSTYGAVANFYERNRRLSGAYGVAYQGEANYLNPLNKITLINEDHFYYLQDFVGTGRYAHLFIQGLTFFTKDRPAIYWQYYNSSFTTYANSYYRVDILGDEYPYYRDGIKVDVVIQQFNTGVGNRPVSDKIFLTFAEVTSHPYHSEYQMQIPITLMLFNDKLYDASQQPIIDNNPPDDNPPYTPPTPPDDPPVDNPPPVDQPSTPYSPYQYWGGDTTDTGMSPSGVTPVNIAFPGDAEPREIEYFTPGPRGHGRWWDIFRWY